MKNQGVALDIGIVGGTVERQFKLFDRAGIRCPRLRIGARLCIGATLRFVVLHVAFNARVFQKGQVVVYLFPVNRAFEAVSDIGMAGVFIDGVGGWAGGAWLAG